MKRVLAWVWTVIAALSGLGTLAQGETISGTAMIVSALCAFPPVWQKLEDMGASIPTIARAITGFLACCVSIATGTLPEPVSDETLLASLEVKIGSGAVYEMEQTEYSETFQRLGEEAFTRANGLAKWPAIGTATSEKCNKVAVVEISDAATAQDLAWLVDCDNGERFRFSEAEAVAVRDYFKNEGDGQQLDLITPTPDSAVFDDISESEIVTKCDIAVKSMMASKSSFDTSFGWDFSRHTATKRVTVLREFEAQNGFGATLSSQYECVVDVANMEFVSLRIQEPTGWTTLYSE